MGKARAEGAGEEAERQEEHHDEEEGGLRGGAGGHGLGFNAARRLRAAGSAMLRPNIERDGGVKVLCFQGVDMPSRATVSLFIWSQQ